jgi:hypothetical protein
LEAGFVWWVENGEKIKIWKDRWLPPPCTFLFCPPHHGLDFAALVSMLIDPTIGWWIFPLVRSIFPLEEAKQICSVAHSPLRNSDIFRLRVLTILSSEGEVDLRESALMQRWMKGCGKDC